MISKFVGHLKTDKNGGAKRKKEREASLRVKYQKIILERSKGKKKCEAKLRAKIKISLIKTG